VQYSTVELAGYGSRGPSQSSVTRTSGGSKAFLAWSFSKQTDMCRGIDPRWRTFWLHKWQVIPGGPSSFLRSSLGGRGEGKMLRMSTKAFKENVGRWIGAAGSLRRHT
jgi:hypothetical protein